MVEFFRRKPYLQCIEESRSSKLVRSLSLWDLVSIGVGGTVGSGIFVLTGLITHRYSGGGVIYSWLIAGMACLMSALSYAELSSLISLGGSSYVYTYIALGELPAFISACCLSLEYGIAGAAVSSSWSDKVEAWINSMMSSGNDEQQFSMHVTAGGIKFNFLSAIIQILVVLLVLGGVDLSKSVINGFTALKIFLIVFIIVAGLWLYSPNNNPSWTPYGVKGVLRGASSCFFGYVGYDEVCCMAGEAKNPRRNVPLAVMYTVAIVTVLYFFAGLALVGMQSYADVNEDTGFSSAFASNHWYFAQHIVAVGEIVTLPIVVLVSFIAQPRVHFALAEDGLLPSVFGEVDRHGNLRKNIIITGVVMVLVALCVPFKYLDDLISGGVLISFNFTNTSIILAKFDTILISSNFSSISNMSSIHGVKSDGHFIYRFMTYFHIVALVCSLLLVSLSYSLHPLLIAVTVMTAIGTFWFVYTLYSKYQEHITICRNLNNLNNLSGIDSSSNNNSRNNNKNSNSNSNSAHGIINNEYDVQELKQEQDGNEPESRFSIPFFPATPLLGIIINYYLLGQLSKEGYFSIIIYFSAAMLLYFLYGNRHHRPFKTNYSAPVPTSDNDGSGLGVDTEGFEMASSVASSAETASTFNPLGKSSNSSSNSNYNSNNSNSNNSNSSSSSSNTDKLVRHSNKDYMSLSTSEALNSKSEYK